MDYATLKTNIAAWLHRDDLTSYLDTFIDLFEARMNRNLRTSDMEQRAYTAVDAEYVELPSGFLELRNVQDNTVSPPVMLTYAPPAKIDQMRYSGGTPIFYTIVGNELQFAPSASGRTIEIDYYKEITPLGAGTETPQVTDTTNWVSNKHPDYYLYGCILEALKFTQDERVAYVSQMVDRLEAEINSKGKRKALGASPLVVQAI